MSCGRMSGGRLSGGLMSGGLMSAHRSTQTNIGANMAATFRGLTFRHEAPDSDPPYLYRDSHVDCRHAVQYDATRVQLHGRWAVLNGRKWVLIRSDSETRLTIA